MKPLEIAKIASTLRDPYRTMILGNVLGMHENRILGLNALITGPGGSGKTTEAQAYADALVATGLAPPGKIMTIYPGSDILRHPPMPGFVGFEDHPLKEGKTGILIIDEADKQLGQGLADKFLLQLLTDGKFVVLMTSYTDKFLGELNPDLREKIPGIIPTERSFTPEELLVYKAEKSDGIKQIDQEWRRTQVVAAWLEMKTLDICPDRDFDAPAKARFIKKPQNQL